MELEYKEFRPDDVKVDGQTGDVTVRFATLNVVDKDGDITDNGAFDTGASAKISAYNHASSFGQSKPIGKGVISEENNAAIFRGKFFLDTIDGNDTYKTVKNMGNEQEWSYGFKVLQSENDTVDGQPVRRIKKVKVYEVSPVLVGAGVNTGTVDIKSAADDTGDEVKAAIPYKKTEVKDVTWSGPKMEARISNDAGSKALRMFAAWVDPKGNADAKSSYKFGHHFVTPSGDVQFAVLRACVAAIAVLNGGRGGADIPDADRKGVYNHVAHHIRDFGNTPPALKTSEEIESDKRAGTAPTQFLEHAKFVKDAARRFLERARNVAVVRKAHGKTAIREENRAQLTEAAKQFRELADEIDNLTAGAPISDEAVKMAQTFLATQIQYKE